MNVKVLASLLVIGIVGAMLGAGTFAAFSDTETSSDNTFTAGTLDLKVNGGDVDVNLSIGNLKPGDSGTLQTLKLNNSGTLPGNLTAKVTIAGVADTCDSEPEETDDSDCSSADADGDLIDELTLKIDGQTVTNGQTITLATPLAANGEIDVAFEYAVNNTAGNEIQGDGVTLDVTFTLAQLSNSV